MGDGLGRRSQVGEAWVLVDESKEGLGSEDRVTLTLFFPIGVRPVLPFKVRRDLVTPRSS